MQFVANQEKEVANSCDSLQIMRRRLQISAICCKSEEVLVHMLKVIVMRCKSGLRGCKLFLLNDILRLGDLRLNFLFKMLFI